jgi:peptidoglycan biosynthesis protein MviN/MurJ (putative lipid II flippase)
MLALAFPLFAMVDGGGPQVAALALAYSLAYWVGLVLAWIILSRRLGSMETGRTVWALLRTLAAGLIAAGAMVLVTVAGLARIVDTEAGDWQTRVLLLLVVILVSVIGFAVFGLAAWALRVREVGDVLSLVRRMTGRLTSRRSGS